MNEAIHTDVEPDSPLGKGSLSGTRLDKVVVAIHGIGSQLRSETLRSVARRFGSRAEPPIPVLPLGYFHIEKSGVVRVSRLDVSPPQSPHPLERIGFAEVFWADIPRKVVKEEDVLEETKAWGATVISRAQDAYRRKVVPTGNATPELTSEDFQLATGALDEVIETVEVLENLCSIAALAGVFKFDLAPLLRDYLGDVQLVTEFGYFRQKIVHRFHDAMEQIVKKFKEEDPNHHPEFYVVAHSEGTVISFLGLLAALSGRRVDDPDDPPSQSGPPIWINDVRGFMTIGSPIDKHLVLWPKIWEQLDLRCAAQPDGSVVFPGKAGQPRLTLPQPIRWRNYYDFGDPIGFQLDIAAHWLREQHCSAFEFSTEKHDFGFSRYLLPGKAHNDYWNDPEVFGHFIDDVVLKDHEAICPSPPKNRPISGIISTAIPYAVSLVCHVGAVFILFKAVTAYAQTGKLSAGKAGSEIAILTLLLAGITVAARLPRLVKPGAWKWRIAAVVAFLVGAVPYVTLLSDETRAHLGQVFNGAFHTSGSTSATIGVLVLATLVALSGWIVPRRPRIARRTLVACGALAVLLIVVGRLCDRNGGEAVWPVLLAGATFLYLWWLGILIFDLAFMWHRYVRNSVAISNLWYWNKGQDAGTDQAGDPGPRKGARRKTCTVTGGA